MPVQLPAHQLYSFAVDPQDRNRIYAATDGGLFTSDDNVWRWLLLEAGPCHAIEVDPFDSADPNTPGLRYAAGGPLLRSTDGGDSWTVRWIGPSRQDMSPSAWVSTNSLGDARPECLAGLLA